MSSKPKYPWLSTSVKELNGWQAQEADRYLNAIDSKKDWNGIQKETAASMAVGLISRSAQSSSALKKPLDRWPSMKAWKEAAEKINLNRMEKYRAAGLITIMTGTVVSFFLGAILCQNYVISFSADALAAAAAGAFLIRNLQIQYRTVSAYGMTKYWLALWITAGVLCVLLKLVLPPAFDASLAVLFAAYYFTKKNLAKVQEAFLKTV